MPIEVRAILRGDIYTGSIVFVDPAGRELSAAQAELADAIAQSMNNNPERLSMLAMFGDAGLVFRGGFYEDEDDDDDVKE